jgi:archaellum component FlaF (FlaF/FlaG flagellin family)
MGAETSVVIALFFAVFLAVAAAVYTSTDYYSNLVKNAQYKQEIIKKDQIQTAIKITNISYTNVSYSGSYLNITIQNTGTTSINASRFQILINGVYYYPPFTLSPPGNTLVPQNSTNISFYGITAGYQDATVTIDNTGDKAQCSGCNKIEKDFITSGNNGILIIGLSYSSNPGTTTVTYSNNPLIPMQRAMVGNNGNYYAELWYLINPPSSGDKKVRQSQTGPNSNIVIGGWSYTGVDQVTGIGNVTKATGTSNRSNVNITTTVLNSVLVSIEGDSSGNKNNLNNGPGQTLRYKEDNGNNNVVGGGEDMTTTNINTYNMNWTLGVSKDWVNIAAEIRPHTSLTGYRIKIVTENGISDYAIAP